VCERQQEKVKKAQDKAEGLARRERSAAEKHGKEAMRLRAMLEEVETTRAQAHERIR
jgi:hypothetical protein